MRPRLDQAARQRAGRRDRERKAEADSTRSGGQGSAGRRERHDKRASTSLGARSAGKRHGVSGKDPRPTKRRPSERSSSTHPSPLLRRSEGASPRASQKEASQPGCGSAAGQMALVRAADQDANRRRAVDRSRQDPRQWRPRAEAEPTGAYGRRDDGRVSRQAAVVRVMAASERRGPASLARTLYEDLTPPAPPAPARKRGRGRARPSATAAGSTRCATATSEAQAADEANRAALAAAGSIRPARSSSEAFCAVTGRLKNSLGPARSRRPARSALAPRSRRPRQ